MLSSPDLRHGVASLMLAGGADIAVVSERTGHFQARVPADIDSRMAPETTQRPHPGRVEPLVVREPPVGIEPTTFSLRVRCSTD